MNRLFFFVFLLLIGKMGFPSDYNTDTTLINNWLNSSKSLLYTQPDSANVILDSAYKKSLQINYSNGLYIALNQKGIICYMKGRFEESIDNYNKAMEYANPQHPYEHIRLLINISYSLRRLNLLDSALVITEEVLHLAREHELEQLYQQTILDLAYSYMEQENYTKAATYYHQVINDNKTNNDIEYLIKSYSSLAIFYYRLEDFENSKRYFVKAIELDSISQSKTYLSTNYVNLGLLYQKVKKDYDSAIYNYKKSMNYTPEFDKERNALVVDINIGNCFLELHVLDSAYKFYNRAVKNPLISDYPSYQAAVFTNLGMYYLNKKELKNAQKYLLDGLNISKEIGHLEFQQKAFLNLFELDSLQNKFSEAIKHYQNYHHISQLRNTEEVNHQMAILDYEKFMVKEKYNNDLLTKENQNQNQKILIQNIVIGLIASGLLVVSVFFIIVAKNRRKIKILNNNLKISNQSLENLNTDLQLQKKEMKELLMSKDRFVSILGHDLKNPFTGLLGLLEIMLEDWDDISEEEKKDGIQLLHKTSIQTFHLLEDLLDWGKTQQGLISLSVSTFAINDVFQEVQNIFQLNLFDKKIELEYELKSDTKAITDKKLLSQIIQNFVGNAIKYSYPGSKIQLTAKDNPDAVKICVIDHGIGIPEDKIDTLFDLDKYFNRPGTQNEKSTGMGLILCHEYAKILQAKITIESKVDAGSTFCLILPKA